MTILSIELILVLNILTIVVFSQNTIDVNSRINCFPEIVYDSVKQTDCQNRGCIFDDQVDYKTTIPQCYYPPNTGYIIESSSTNSLVLKKSSSSIQNPYGQDFDELLFAWQEIGAGIHLTISPKNITRYRPPIGINENPNLISSDKLTLVTQNDTIFSFRIQRQSSGADIWNTSLGGLLFSDKYLQIATKLPSKKIYGFGENIHQTIMHNLTKYLTWGIYTRDQQPNSKDFNTYNYYGAHPFYMGLEPDGSSYGVFIFNSNPQDVTTGPMPHLVYRTIGGQLEFFFFPGPTPEEVIQQYLSVIGYPKLPPYWALGFGLSHSPSTLDGYKDAISRMMQAGIPFDKLFIGIKPMNSDLDFTLAPDWSDLPNYTNWLHENGMHLIPAFDPAVEVDYATFQRAIEMNASFLEWPNYSIVPSTNDDYPLIKGTKIMLGNVWPPNNTAYPDFLDPLNNTNQWWANEYTLYYKNVVNFDGIWLDMNEPSNFGTTGYNESGPPPNTKFLHCPLYGPDSEWDVPPYFTFAAYSHSGTHLCTDSICMLAMTSRGTTRFYDTHNLYGWGEARLTHNAIRQATGKRGEILTRSSFASSGRYASHWLGDNTARWEDLRTSIIGVQEFNMFGIPMTGADICGYNGESNEELCLRWQQLGAFHPFMRNHNAAGANQDPATWPSVAQAARKANLFRYRHLPYLYSLLFAASLRGGTVVRPVFFEFPLDNNTHDLSYQFLWGSALLVAPVVYEGANSTNVYLPSSAIWYSVYDYFYGTNMTNGWTNFTAPPTYLIPVFVRGGYVLPRQRPSTTTVASRLNEFQLLIALDKNLGATGELFWDDGESIIPNDILTEDNYYHFLYNFTLTKELARLNITLTQAVINLTLSTLDNIEIFGYAYNPNLKSATLNGQPLTINTQTSSYSPFTQVLNISTTGLINLNAHGPQMIIEWNNMSSLDSIFNSRPPIERSKQMLVDCQRDISSGCISGNREAAIKYVNTYGLTTEANYPYTGIDDASMCSPSKRDTPPLIGKGMLINKLKPFCFFNNADEIREWIYNIGPAQIDMRIMNNNPFLQWTGWEIQDARYLSLHLYFHVSILRIE